MNTSEAEDARIIAHTKPSVSERRRLQNRLAQRKFRERKAQKKKPQTEYPEDAGSGQPCDPGDSEAHYEVGSHEYTGDMDGYFQIDSCYDEVAALALASLDHESAYMALEAGSYQFAGESVHPDDVIATTQAEDQDPHHANYILPVAFSLDDSPTAWTPSLQSRSSSVPHQLSGYQTPGTPGSVLPTISTPFTSNLEDDNPTSPQPPYPPANPAACRVIPDHHLQQQHHPQPTYGYHDYHKSVTATTAARQTAAAPLLHVATRSRNRRIMMTLLKHGVPPNERDELGRTALHVAASQGDESLVSLLLRYGADPAICDLRGQTALYTAVEGGFGEVVELLLEKSTATADSLRDAAGGG
ncbi:hypothetical protein B0J18DRAFT_65904 [Chaetomium sp. MPI-SDFR-AT-0129]|nr:hypothetical protein B0J18DRAFT_65904 [Chaetomium sp. MPI-SDFR-AT-0129]